MFPNWVVRAANRTRAQNACQATALLDFVFSCRPSFALNDTPYFIA